VCYALPLGLSLLSGLLKYALFVKYNKTSVKKIPPKPINSIGLCGKSYWGIVIVFYLVRMLARGNKTDTYA